MSLPLQHDQNAHQHEHRQYYPNNGQSHYVHIRYHSTDEGTTNSRKIIITNQGGVRVENTGIDLVSSRNPEEEVYQDPDKKLIIIDHGPGTGIGSRAGEEDSSKTILYQSGGSKGGNTGSVIFSASNYNG